MEKIITIRDFDHLKQFVRDNHRTKTATCLFMEGDTLKAQVVKEGIYNIKHGKDDTNK